MTARRLNLSELTGVAPIDPDSVLAAEIRALAASGAMTRDEMAECLEVTPETVDLVLDGSAPQAPESGEVPESAVTRAMTLLCAVRRMPPAERITLGDKSRWHLVPLPAQQPPPEMPLPEWEPRPFWTELLMTLRRILAAPAVAGPLCVCAIFALSLALAGLAERGVEHARSYADASGPSTGGLGGFSSTMRHVLSVTPLSARTTETPQGQQTEKQFAWFDRETLDFAVVTLREVGGKAVDLSVLAVGTPGASESAVRALVSPPNL